MKSYAVVVVVTIIFLTTVFIPSIAAADTQSPAYSNFDFDPKTVGDEEKVTCTVTLTDDESGIKYAVVSFITSSGTTVVDCRLSDKNLVSGDNFNGNYENDCTVNLPDGLESVEANATLTIFDNASKMITVNSLGTLTVTKESQNRDDNSGATTSNVFKSSNVIVHITILVLQLLALLDL